MTIPLIKEADEVADMLWGIVERCHFCKERTKFWHENTNNPVCPQCAKLHRVGELPDHGARIRAAKRELEKV